MNTNHLLSNYGYWALFIIVALESLGIPVPGETILISAGILAGHAHNLNPWLIWLLASAAAIIGDNIGFWVGDKGGYSLLKKYGRYIRVREPEIKLGRYIFDRHGGKVVFFGRFVSVLRTYAAFLAGTTRMEWRKFLVFNAAGGIVWAGIYTFIAYYAGNWLRQASGTIDVVVGVIAAGGVIAGIVFVRRKAKDLEDVAERAYPGPLPD
jgi:membrane protein DedA with SNARE-associated domain